MLPHQVSKRRRDNLFDKLRSEYRFRASWDVELFSKRIKGSCDLPFETCLNDGWRTIVKFDVTQLYNTLWNLEFPTFSINIYRCREDVTALYQRWPIVFRWKGRQAYG